MKKVLFGFTICLFSITNSLSQEHIAESLEVVTLNWESTFKGALKKAKKEKKPVLIYFTGSDWCSPCKVLDKKIFHTEKFKKMAEESLILYMVDVPRNRDLVNEKTRKLNKQLSKRYGQKSFPTLIFVDDKGKMLDIKKGVYMTEYYYPFFEKTIARY